MFTLWISPLPVTVRDSTINPSRVSSLFLGREWVGGIHRDMGGFFGTFARGSWVKGEFRRFNS